MYAKVRTSVTYTDYANNNYHDVTAVVSEVDENATNYTFIDLSNYPNGGEVVGGWVYYPDTDTFYEVPLTPTYKYYVVLNDVGVITNTIQTTETISVTGYMEVTEAIFYSVSVGMVYYNNAFMTMEEANYRMLLALSTSAN